mmetsp:Transcript_44782/g.118778  ORF Transcript_44782/g.118778 Transcript_44782/m.118778 type:complete len:162 (-) Transcript_44782:160-645(-)
MLRSSCFRFAALSRASPRLVTQQAFKDPPVGAGKTLYPPETIQETLDSVKSVVTPATKSDFWEALGYPGQKHASGVFVTVGRNSYGPGRYDYGRPLRSGSWFHNFFYGVWEFGHLFLVADKWIAMRWVRHFVATAICLYPMLLMGRWTREEHLEFKEQFGS